MGYLCSLERRGRAFRAWLFVMLILALLGCSAGAALLTDSQLYIDPASIGQDFYVHIDLGDLTAQNSYLWAAGSDPVVGAKILPVLKTNNYTSGYAFSQNDYLDQPNVDYSADLTSGNLTAQFLIPGLYHVDVMRAGGDSQIFAVFAEAGLKQEDGKPSTTGASQKMVIPDADLILVEQRDKTLDDAAKVWAQEGKTVERTTSRQDVIDKIKAKSEALGRKIHVELDGHGYAGYISTGGGWMKGADYFLDLSNAKDFQSKIDKYVDYITFQGCSTGAGTDGAKFLKIFADSVGQVGAWDQPTGVVAPSGTNKGYFTVPIGAKFVIVPEPSALFVIACGMATMILLMRTQRRRHGEYWYS